MVDTTSNSMQIATGNLAAAHRARVLTRQGFTLIELLITVVILAVLAAIAVPSMREFIARQRVEGIAKELATDLKYLRAKSIEGKATVRIKFGSNDANTCYVMFAPGVNELDCNCARTDGLSSCGNSAGRGEEFKTVSIPKNRLVTLAAVVTSTPVAGRLELEGFNGLPVYDTSTRKHQTIVACVAGTGIGGELRVYTTDRELILPKLCSVGGRHGAFPTCPTGPVCPS